MEYRLARLSQYVRGWMGYFGLSEYYTILPTLDEWLRRRVRSCYWKMWRRPRKAKPQSIAFLASHRLNRPVRTRLPLVVWGPGAKHSRLPDLAQQRLLFTIH